MKSVYKIIETVQMKPISKEDYNDLVTGNNISFAVVNSINSDTLYHNNFFSEHTSAIKSAIKNNKVVISKSIIKNGNRYLAIYNPLTGEFYKKTINKSRYLVEVSEEEYNNYLKEIKEQKQEDIKNKYFPKSPDYYNIERWTF